MSNKWFHDMIFTKQPLLGGKSHVTFHTNITDDAVKVFGSTQNNGEIMLQNIIRLEKYHRILYSADVQGNLLVVKVIGSVNCRFGADIIEQVVKEFAQTVSDLLDELTSESKLIKVYRYGMLPLPKNYDSSYVSEISILLEDNSTSYIYHLTDEAFEFASEYMENLKRTINTETLKCENAYFLKDLKSIVAAYPGKNVSYYIIDGVKDIINLFIDYHNGIKALFNNMHENANKNKESVEENE